jgi:hypothetical protein
MLADNIAWALPDLRAEAEGAMTSTCTIRARSAGQVTDPDTGEVTDIPGAIVYTGRCRVRPASGPGGNSTERDAGAAELLTYDYLVSVPFSVSTVVERQRVTIDSSPDPALVGIEVEILHVDRGEHITARRLVCREVS